MTLKRSENIILKPASILTIDKVILHQNLAFFKSFLKKETLTMVMVKANAYGHGAIEIATELERSKSVHYFGVANIQQGIKLRKAGIELPIMVTNPISSDFKLLCEFCLEPVIHNVKLAKSFAEFIQGSSLVKDNYPVHLKVNTGMNRFGIDEEDLEQILSIHQKASWRVKSIMSHLSCSDDPLEDEFTISQLDKFAAIKSKIESHFSEEVIWHILNSNGVIRFSEHQYQMVRIGIGLYGGSEYLPARNLIRPIATFQAQIAQIRHVKKGASISYSRSGKANEDTFIGVLDVGYADGFPRSLGNGNWKLEFNGKLYPTIGNVCMDYTLIDLGSKLPQLKLEEYIILFGGQKSIFEFAKAQNTICYEAMTNIGNRVQRLLIN